MASFLQEAHGRLTAQRQIYIAEQLGLGKALFQEFRKDPKQEVLLHLDPGHLSHLDWCNCSYLKIQNWIAYIHLIFGRTAPRQKDYS